MSVCYRFKWNKVSVMGTVKLLEACGVLDLSVLIDPGIYIEFAVYYKTVNYTHELTEEKRFMLIFIGRLS